MIPHPGAPGLSATGTDPALPTDPLQTLTMRTLVACTLCLIVGAAYGDYMIEGVRAGMTLIEQQRQS